MSAIALIYSYYEDGVTVEGDDANRTYVYKLCKAKGINKFIRAPTTSNLISHLKTDIHQKEYIEFEKKKEPSTPHQAIKRRRLEINDSPKSFTSMHSPISSSITQSPKYSNSSIKQKER